MRYLIPLILLAAHACAQSVNTVTLMWNLSTADGITWQSVYRSEECSGVYVKRAEVNSTEVEWTDYNVKTGQTLCYYITANDHQQESAPSNVVQVQIPTN